MSYRLAVITVFPESQLSFKQTARARHEPRPCTLLTSLGLQVVNFIPAHLAPTANSEALHVVADPGEGSVGDAVGRTDADGKQVEASEVDTGSQAVRAEPAESGAGRPALMAGVHYVMEKTGLKVSQINRISIGVFRG